MTCKIEAFSCSTIFYRVEFKRGPATSNTMTGRGVPEEFFHISSLIYVKDIIELILPFCFFEHPNDLKEERREWTG